jgi:hypothetical protein
METVNPGAHLADCPGASLRNYFSKSVIAKVGPADKQYKFLFCPLVFFRHDILL